MTTPPRFEDLGLRPEVLRAVVEAGYIEPTPIQARAIPEILARRDMIGLAQTGTGKTASFVLPMLDILASGRARARIPRSLILSPTRELATQTARNFETYGKYLSLSMALLIGGVGMGEQEKLLEKGVDVLIATPGRLLDWFERGKVMLNGVDILVIDEADRMFDMGFMPDVERILSVLIGRRQTLLFSATMPPEVRRLADRFLKQPVEIQVARPAQSAAAIEDVLVSVDPERKRQALASLVRQHEIPKAIVFCNRKRDIGGVMRYLQREGLNARDLHGDLDQSHRQATLDQFQAGTIDFLVATDVAARGLDVTDMPVVVNYDVPIHAEDYIHRIGRTGRAGRKGRAFTLITGEDGRAVQAIEKLMSRTIDRIEIGSLEGVASDEPASTARRERRVAPAPRPSTTTGPTSAPRPAPVAAGEGETRPVRRRPPRPAAVSEMVDLLPNAPIVEPATPPARPRPEHARAAEPREPRRPSREREAAMRDGFHLRGGLQPRERAAPPPRRPRREEVEDKPVVAFGDQVPRFLMIRPPAPATPRVKEG